MHALYFKNCIRFRRNMPMPDQAGESLIRVRLAGICSTDLEISKGYMEFTGIPGHEFVGEVVDSDHPHLIGQRVVGEINAGCGRCKTCRNRGANHCPHRSVLGILNRAGSFAEYLSLPTQNLHQVPETLSDEEAVFTEPLAAAFRILEQISIQKKDHVILIGDGKLGLLIAQILKDKCRLLMVGKHKERHLLYDQWEIPFLSLQNTKSMDSPADIVIDCTGTPQGFQLAQQWVRPEGNIILKSTCAAAHQINLAPIVINEVSLIGSRCGPFRPAINALQAKNIDTNALISDIFPLKKGHQAFKKAAQSGVLKVLLKP